MLDQHRLGFYEGWFAACSFRHALEVGVVGHGILCIYFDDKGDLKFSKGLDFMEFEEGSIAIKRVAYR